MPNCFGLWILWLLRVVLVAVSCHIKKSYSFLLVRYLVPEIKIKKCVDEFVGTNSKVELFMFFKIRTLFPSLTKDLNLLPDNVVAKEQLILNKEFWNFKKCFIC